MNDIINAYREMALRLSIIEANELAASGTPVVQTVPYSSLSQRVQYEADRKNLAVAVVISLLGPFATFWLFWGWWALGRRFSMSPLEVANAFRAAPHGDGYGAPSAPTAAADVLAAFDGNLRADKLAAQVHHGGHGVRPDPKVQYGVMNDGNHLCMAIVEQNTVRPPRVGEVL